MTTGGVTAAGFIQPTAAEISDSIATGLLTTVSAALDTSDDQPMGQVVGVFSDELADVWAAFGSVYNSLDPDNAEGVLLANVSAISGTRPQTATYSTVTLSVTLNSGSTLNAGAIASVVGQPSNTWVTLAAVGPVGSTGVYTVAARSSQPGPFVANAGTITSIVTPSTGWTAVTNAANAVAGLAADTDTTLRQKREAELQGEGSGDADAIRAAVLKVPGVVQAFVFENKTVFPDSVTGLPAKSFRVVVWDGPGMSAANNDIAQAIWSRKPTGGNPFGGTNATATASDGSAQTIFFDRATQVPIYITLTTTPSTLTTAQTTAIKTALSTYASANWNLGIPVIALALRAQALLPGLITDVPTFFLGTAPSPSGTGNITISGLQIPTLSTANILVNGV